MWLTSKEFRKKYNISSQQLYALKKTGKIETKPSIGSSYLVKDSCERKSHIAYHICYPITLFCIMVFRFKITL